VRAHGNDSLRCGRCNEVLEINEPVVVEYRESTDGSLRPAAVGPFEHPLEPRLIDGAFHVLCHRAVEQRRERLDLPDGLPKYDHW
jgi:hypothetical protein